MPRERRYTVEPEAHKLTIDTFDDFDVTRPKDSTSYPSSASFSYSRSSPQCSDTTTPSIGTRDSSSRCAAGIRCSGVRKLNSADRVTLEPGMQSYPDEFTGDIIQIALNRQGFSTAC